MRIKYLGHSCFEIETQYKKILIDPFLVMSPNYIPEDICDIFVTHAHSDHLGSAVEISKYTGARITAIFELANYCEQKGASTNGINLGGWIDYEWGRVLAVSALHSSSTEEGIYGGCPCSYLFDIEGKLIFHAGDTSLNSEFKTLGELYNIDIAILPIGGHYTMDIEQATIASEWLDAKTVIPMHYNTFEKISIDVTNFEKKIATKGKKPLVLKVNQITE